MNNRNGLFLGVLLLFIVFTYAFSLTYVPFSFTSTNLGLLSICKMGLMIGIFKIVLTIRDMDKKQEIEENEEGEVVQVSKNTGIPYLLGGLILIMEMFMLLIMYN